MAVDRALGANKNLITDLVKMARRLVVLVLGLLPPSKGLQQALRILPAFASHQSILPGSFVTITGNSLALAEVKQFLLVSSTSSPNTLTEKKIHALSRTCFFAFSKR